MGTRGERVLLAAAVAVWAASIPPWYVEGWFGESLNAWGPPAAAASTVAVLLTGVAAAEVLLRVRLGATLGPKLAQRAGLAGVGPLHLVVGLASLALVVVKLLWRLEGAAPGMLLALAAHGWFAYAGYLVYLDTASAAAEAQQAVGGEADSSGERADEPHTPGDRSPGPGPDHAGGAG